MSTTTLIDDKSARGHHLAERDRIAAEALEARWFDAPPPSSRARPSVPPVYVGAFLGDPEVDSWLR